MWVNQMDVSIKILIINSIENGFDCTFSLHTHPCSQSAIQLLTMVPNAWLEMEGSQFLLKGSFCRSWLLISLMTFPNCTKFFEKWHKLRVSSSILNNCEMFHNLNIHIKKMPRFSPVLSYSFLINISIIHGSLNWGTDKSSPCLESSSSVFPCCS